MQQSVVISSPDNLLNETLSTFFTKKGFEALFEVSASSAILKTFEQDISFYLLDCTKNFQECLELIQIIHRIKPSLPIVTVCDENDFSMLQRISEMGIFYRLYKPIQIGELDMMMDALIKYRERISHKFMAGNWYN